MTLLIGTAGWAIPASVRHQFPTEGTGLQRYAQVMGCVEVNSSFHRPHRCSTWERWASSVPDGFRFAAKLPKTISHTRRLVNAETELDRFMGEVSGLGDRLAVLLLQLPPSLVFDPELTNAFLAHVRSLTDVLIVVEPRHPSWFEPPADALFVSHKVARVAADPARAPAGAVPGGWRGLTYYRLHGSPAMYRTPYGHARLQAYAATLANDVAAGRPTWCVFDNTASSAALGDALDLAQLMTAGSSPLPSGELVHGETEP